MGHTAKRVRDRYSDRPFDDAGFLDDDPGMALEVTNADLIAWQDGGSVPDLAERIINRMKDEAAGLAVITDPADVANQEEMFSISEAGLTERQLRQLHALVVDGAPTPRVLGRRAV